MDRRSFIKRLGGFLSLAYVNPTALIPNTAKDYIEFTVSQDDLYFLGDFAEKFIEPAMIKLANEIDEYVYNALLKNNKIWWDI